MSTHHRARRSYARSAFSVGHKPCCVVEDDRRFGIRAFLPRSPGHFALAAWRPRVIEYPHINGCSILVVEDEPLIVMDISTAFEKTGAHLTTTNTVRHAKLLVEHDGICAAIVDHALPDGDSTSLCERLTERGIPFLIYSGYRTLDGLLKDAPHLAKPASHEALLEVIEALIRDSNILSRNLAPMPNP